MDRSTGESEDDNLDCQQGYVTEFVTAAEGSPGYDEPSSEGVADGGGEDVVYVEQSDHQETAAATHSAAADSYNETDEVDGDLGRVDGEGVSNQADQYYGDAGTYYDEEAVAAASGEALEGGFADGLDGEEQAAAYNGEEEYQDAYNGGFALESEVGEYSYEKSGSGAPEELQVESVQNIFQVAGDPGVDTAPAGAQRIAPETGAVAQVILITTSLGSVRRQFFGSRRAQKSLDCKGVPYFLIDANREVAQGAELVDSTLLEFWNGENLLLLDSSDATKISLPQVLFDGVAIGDEIALQDLEEDGDLDWILARAACPSCLNERHPDDFNCNCCGVAFYPELISEELVSSGRVQRILRGFKCVGDGSALNTLQPMNYAEIVKLAEQEQRKEHTALETYEELFGEPPPDE